MEISLHTTAAAPISTKPLKNGAAPPLPTVETAKRAQTHPTAIPTGLGQIGAVNETRINTLKDGKTPPAGFDRTLKPYDTIMLPYAVVAKKQVQHTA